MAPSELLSGAAGLGELLEFTDALAADLPELCDADEFFSLPVVKEEPHDLDVKPRVGIVTSSNAETSVAFSIVETKPTKMLTEEEKRERIREKDRQKYYRRKDNLANLKKQVAELELQLKVMSKSKQGSLTSSSSSKALVMKGAKQPESRREQLQALYLELAQTKMQLRSENTQLRKQFREASQRATLLYDLLSAEQKLYHTYESYFRILTPLTQQMHRQLHSQAVNTMQSFTTISTTRAAMVDTIGGWRGSRFVEGHLFKYALKKSFRINAETLASKVWLHVVNPSGLRSMYSDEIDMKARLVQQLDDDNYVFLEEMRSIDRGVEDGTLKTVVLMSRFKVKNGYRLYVQNLDRRLIEMEDKLTGEQVGVSCEMWISNEQLVWIEFDSTGADSVDVTFCGVLPTVSAHSYYWMAEIVLLAIRCESAVVGPRFTVPSSS